ncbi:molybdopterin-guanine dinucleotide biosynthesis protein B [Paenibacillus sp. FSL L8-0436]|uniref:molybdopterin-guanine dinucleotide biosynthesis protein B n=1 Tax=Paenibacillus sp. FSL L8-0436 TaxID=2954686 RepID=UPI003158CA4B
MKRSKKRSETGQDFARLNIGNSRLGRGRNGKGKNSHTCSRNAGRTSRVPAGSLRTGEESNGGGSKSPPAVCQIVGYKNSGKTTLICDLIPLLQRHGCTVAVIKHDAHDYEMDHPGTDTWQQRQAGASAIAITSSRKTSVIEERSSSLAELVSAFSSYDYVLVEGFKHEAYPKLVLVHKEEDLSLLNNVQNKVAAAFWEEMKDNVRIEPGIRQFSINDSAAIAEFLWQQRTYFQNFNI